MIKFNACLQTVSNLSDLGIKGDYLMHNVYKFHYKTINKTFDLDILRLGNNDLKLEEQVRKMTQMILLALMNEYKEKTSFKIFYNECCENVD